MPLRSSWNASWIALALVLVAGLVFVVTRGGVERENAALERGAQRASAAIAPRAELDAPPVPAAQAPPIVERDERASEREAAIAEPDTARAAPIVAGPLDLVVRVLDLGGRPLAGVPVRLTPVVRHDGTWPDESLRGVSAADGRIVFAGERARLDALAASASDAEPATWSLVHEVAFEEPPALALTPEVLALEVVETTQPPFGALEVRVFELEGAPAQRIERVELELVLAAESDDPSLARERRRFHAPFDGERALFAHVEPGRECVARALRATTGFRAEVRGPGPPRAGTQARIDVVMGADRPFLLFRALDEAGRVLADTELQARMSHVIFSGASERVRTDDEGRFRVELDLELGALFGQELELTTVDEAPQRVGRWSAWRDFEPGPNDCGDVRLERPELLVAGRVLDEEGRAVEGAIVRCGDSANYVEQHHFLGGPDASRETRSDAEGRFELRGRPADTAAKVWAFRPHHEPLPGFGAGDGAARSGFALCPAVPFVRGDADVVLRLIAACQPVLQVLLPVPPPGAGDVPFDQELQVRLVRAGEPGDELQHQNTNHTPEGRFFVFHPALPGHFELTCTLGGVPLPTTMSLELGLDGSLGVLDLRDACFIHALRLRAPDDASLKGAWRMRPAGSAAEWAAHTFNGALATITTTEPSIDVELFPEGFAAELVEGLSGLREVTLRPALRVRLVLVTDGPLPALPYVFDPYLELDGQSVGRAEGSPYFTASKRESLFLLPRAGTFTVGWHFEKQLPNGAVGTWVLDEHRLEIVVEETAGEQRIELHLPGDALRALVEQPPF